MATTIDITASSLLMQQEKPSADNKQRILNLGWKDNIQPFSSAQGKGTNEPIWEDTGNGLYSMNFIIGDELFVVFHVNHDYAEGTKGYPHIHFFCKSTQVTGASVTWRFSYVIAKGHSQGQSLTTTPINIDITYTYTGNEIAGEHIVVECSELQAIDLIEPDVIITASILLLSETVSGKVYGIMADLHYQSDHEATNNKTPDFDGIII